jgi:hypothetical protein
LTSVNVAALIYASVRFAPLKLVLFIVLKPSTSR